MARLKNPQPAQIPDVLKGTTDYAINGIIPHRFVGEDVMAGIFDCVR